MGAKDKRPILELAKSVKDPDEFIATISASSNHIPYVEKGILFEQIANILFESSFLNHALYTWLTAIEYYSSVNDKKGVGRCYMGLGIAYGSLGDYLKALEYNQRSIEIAIEIGDKNGEGRSYVNLGIASYALGNYSKAIEYYERSLRIAVEIGDDSGQGRTYGSLGNVYHSMGDYHKAVEYNQRSLEVAVRIGDKYGEGSCSIGLGNSYRSLGYYPKAKEYYQRGLRAAALIGNRYGEGTSYIGLGNVHGLLGDYHKAIEYYEKSLRIAVEIGDNNGEGTSNINLGIASFALGNYHKAIEYYQKSLRIAVKIGDKAGECKSCTGLGIAYYFLGDYHKAIEYHQKSLKIAIATGNRHEEGESYNNLSRIYHQSEPELATEYLSKSIDISEGMGAMLVEEEHKVGFYGLQSNAYQSMISLCIQMENKIKAFEYLERSKSKAFLDILSTSTLRPTVGITKKLQLILRNEENNLTKLREIQIQSSKNLNIEIGEADRIRKELEEIYDKLEKIDPEYVSIRRPKSWSSDNSIDSSVQETLANIKRDKGKDAVIVEYFVSTEKTYIFIMTADSIEIVPIDCNESDLFDLVNRFLVELSSHDDINYLEELSQQLSAYLIKPVSKYILKADLIYFIPYGVLHYLPLHALELENNQPLIVGYAIAYLPSSSTLRFLKNKGKSTNSIRSCSSFGVVFKEEARVIAELFNAKAHLDSDVTRGQVVKIMNGINSDILHFSCHGQYNNIDPLSSGLLLYNDEKLTARDILSLTLNSELVTLSACETGVNENKPGDELIGLTRSFIYAGTPCVLVSLWTVDAKSTLNLMVDFYKQLKNGNNKNRSNTTGKNSTATNITKKRIDRVDIATALQIAQKNIMQRKDVDYSHPYYWAPFVLVGDWE